jgi:hypothetical protein
MERSVTSAQGLTKAFATHLAVDGLSFKLQPGRVTGFLGPTAPGSPRPCGWPWGWPAHLRHATVLGRPSRARLPVAADESGPSHS